jgi:hypothetical protein
MSNACKNTDRQRSDRVFDAKSVGFGVSGGDRPAHPRRSPAIVLGDSSGRFLEERTRVGRAVRKSEVLNPAPLKREPMPYEFIAIKTTEPPWDERFNQRSVPNRTIVPIT